jgi:hypothetical protein
MAWTKLKTGLVIGAFAAGALTPILIQQQQVNRLKQEKAAIEFSLAENRRGHDALRERFDRLQNELGVSREQAAEVHGLRNQVVQLRRDQAELTRVQAQADALKSLLQQSQLEEFEAKKEEEEEEAAKQWGLTQLNGTKNLALGIHLFADKNNGQFPANLEQAEAFLPQEHLGTIHLDDYEIIPYRSWSDLQDQEPQKMILIRQKEPRPSHGGKWIKAYAFADGHSEIRAMDSPDAFAAWERERMVPVQP